MNADLVFRYLQTPIDPSDGWQDRWTLPIRSACQHGQRPIGTLGIKFDPARRQPRSGCEARADPEHEDVTADIWLADYDPDTIDELTIKYALRRIAARRNFARTRLAKAKKT